MGMIVKQLPFATGEMVSLIKDEGDDFFILDTSERWPKFENSVTFVMKDKKAMNALASKLRLMIICIEQHAERCDCP